MARRGTELFPELGAHCDEADCNQLDFLPFEFDGCGGFFCAAHRTYRGHGCAKAADEGRTVVFCPDCGDSIERAAPGQAEREILDEHARSGRCDPARKRKPACPAPVQGGAHVLQQDPLQGVRPGGVPEAPVPAGPCLRKGGPRRGAVRRPRRAAGEGRRPAAAGGVRPELQDLLRA